MQFTFKRLLSVLFILFSAPLFAQEQGLDDRINEAFTPIANWWGAGGERNRLALCKLLLSPFNVLVMDEPTNHLDIRSKNVLKEALKKFQGTLILISHDRDFLQGLSDRVLEFKDHKLTSGHYWLRDL